MKCGSKEMGYVVCPGGHYICDRCHGEEQYTAIINRALNIRDITDPIIIAERLLEESDIPMLGCEHAWITAAALMMALRNDGTLNIREEQIREAVERTRRQAIGAFCGLTGICGIAVAMGACFSVLLQAGCPKDRETAITMRTAARVIDSIANQAGPCCCKNFMRVALHTACGLLKEYLEIYIPAAIHNLKCAHSQRHPHGCKKDNCLFYA